MLIKCFIAILLQSIPFPNTLLGLNLLVDVSNDAGVLPAGTRPSN